MLLVCVVNLEVRYRWVLIILRAVRGRRTVILKFVRSKSLLHLRRCQIVGLICSRPICVQTERTHNTLAVRATNWVLVYLTWWNTFICMHSCLPCAGSLLTKRLSHYLHFLRLLMVWWRGYVLVACRLLSWQLRCLCILMVLRRFQFTSVWDVFCVARVRTLILHWNISTTGYWHSRVHLGWWRKWKLPRNTTHRHLIYIFFRFSA